MYSIVLLKQAANKLPNWMGNYVLHFNIFSSMERASFRQTLNYTLTINNSSIFNYFYTAGIATMSLLFEIFNIDNNHWITLVYCFETKEILLFDSSLSDDIDLYLNIFKEGLQLVFMSFAYSGVDAKAELEKWKCALIVDTPRQEPGSLDCGLYSIFIIYSILKERFYIKATGDSETVRYHLYNKIKNKFGKVIVETRQTTPYTEEYENLKVYTIEEKKKLVEQANSIVLDKPKIKSKLLLHSISTIFRHQIYGSKDGLLNICANISLCPYKKDEPKTELKVCIICRAKYHCECLKYINKENSIGYRYFVCNCVNDF